jgi:hypothetical protein
MPRSYDARWVSIKGGEERKWWIRAKAKLDTGAKRCSIDEGLAQALQLPVVGEVNVRNAMGSQVRNIVLASVRVGRTTHEVEMTVADRSMLKCPMLLGKEFLDILAQQPLKPGNKSDVPQFV